MECADLHFVYSCKVESDVSVKGSYTDADTQPYPVGPYLFIYSSKEQGCTMLRIHNTSQTCCIPSERQTEQRSA